MLRPIGASAIVKLDEIENKTLGGILLPNQEKEPVTRGKIISVGKGRTTIKGDIIPMEVKEGDIVIFGAMAGAPVEVEGEEGRFLVIREHEIIAIVE